MSMKRRQSKPQPSSRMVNEHAAVLARHLHVDMFRRILRKREAPLDLRLPLARGVELRFLLVGDAEVSMLDGVDEDLGRDR